MAKKPEIEEFDKLSITDLMHKPSKELIVAIFVKNKEQNNKLKSHEDKLRWHDKILLGIFSVIGLGIISAIIMGVINL
ncbi:MAG: hypothetical protein PVJ67_04350 [Candidatus Pacearchaeota archaeon]|jgi:hypothetical protein